MPSAGDKVRAADIPHRLATASRTTNLGAAVTVDTALGIDAIFTLSRTRRVRVEFVGPFITTTASATNLLQVSLRKNATGAAIATTDTAVRVTAQVGGSTEVSIWWEELLTAGTYAYGPTLQGSGSTTANLNVAAGNPAQITVWDMGDS